MTEFDTAAVDLSGILNKSAEQKAKQLPEPKTFHLLCVVPEAMEEYADSEVGLIKADKTMHYEEVLTPVLFVVNCHCVDARQHPEVLWRPLRCACRYREYVYPSIVVCQDQVAGFAIGSPVTG